MIREDGEKYACESCVRGHRVSSCKHKDRPLTHINKKGRPVSQCQHCRGLRKSRATHVRCVCGELNNGATSDKPASSVQEDHLCPCMDGLRCTCAHKNELHDRAEDAKPATTPHRPLPKPVVTSRKSEPAIPKMKNGHHAPIHRHNNAAHESGLPYQIPRYHKPDDATEDAVRPTGSALATTQAPPLAVRRHTSRPSLEGAPTRAVRGAPSLPEITGQQFPALANPALSPSLQSNSVMLSTDRWLSTAPESDISTNFDKHSPQDFFVTDPFVTDSTHSEQSLFNWDGWNFSNPAPETLFTAAYPQSWSTMPAEQPGLSCSSTGTPSDAGEHTRGAGAVPAVAALHTGNRIDVDFDLMTGSVDSAWGFSAVPASSSTTLTVPDSGQGYQTFDAVAPHAFLPTVAADLVLDFEGHVYGDDNFDPSPYLSSSADGFADFQNTAYASRVGWESAYLAGL